MHLTIIGMIFASTFSMSGSYSSSDTTLQNISSIANIVYSALTVAIVVVAIQSLALTRKQIEENKKQTLETIHTQHRPILVCTSCPVEDTLLNSKPLQIKNVGVGPALNIRVVLSYASTNAGDKLQKGFIFPSVLVPGEHETITLNTPGLNNIPDKIGEYSFFPEGSDTSYNQRFVITYQDIFNHKHLSIFYGRLSTNWKPCVIKSNFKYGIDDVCADWTLLGRKQTKVTYSTHRIY
jgi:hypothetical protein